MAGCAGFALLGAAACGQARAADVEPLPPLRRPSLEERAGLPLVAGRWLFAGFEYPVQDTQAVREMAYQLTPPGEFQVATQRLDSVAGAYLREATAFPFTGEVRRDGIFSFVASEPGGVGQFVAGRFARDTMWIELTGFPSAALWPPGTRVALVHNPRGPAFVRLRGYVPPPPPPVDSTHAAAQQPQPEPAAPPSRPERADTTPRRPTLRIAPETPPEPNDTQPWADTAAPTLPLPVQQPRSRGRRDTPQVPPAEPLPLPGAPPPSAPRDTVRFPPP